MSELKRTKRKRSDVVSASEIASWAWCPESWRLNALGAEPANRGDIARGELQHRRKATFERFSRRVVALGWVLLFCGGLSVLVAFALAVLSLLGRKGRGLGSGRTIALDNATLHSEVHGLVGRPDRIVRDGNRLIPEEWKSAKRVSHRHRLQLATYFLLIEEEYGVRPPFGVVVLGDGSRVQVENTEALRSEVLAIAEQIRRRRRTIGEEIAVKQPVWRCHDCGQRENCGRGTT